ncbi:hypothetical protein CDV31_004418 [Fusarium ambrosium]|uniref:F-box domain-containing protein n=1 Tax=Fusarium ambrosium TaxID=131363 RepID=A0A428URA7_9HYPO|nr:hypothetical protein CDV31_004418 [Fusarium ambrosium]
MEGQRPPPMLDELPPEIHTGIGSHLSGRELDGVTRASKRLRALFLRSIFRRVRFDSTQPEVARSLDLFVNGRSAEDMSGILAAVRSASFILPLSELLDVFSPEEMLPVSLDPLRLKILLAIRLVSQVRRLTVDLELFGDGHVETFRNALPSIPRWEHLHSLKMTGVDHCQELATTLIHSCSSQKLISVDVSGIFSFALAGVVQQYCKRLERLRIEHPFPPLNENHFPAMQYIYESRESLRHVKWLAIAEKNPGDTGSMGAFEQCFEDMLEALQQMPALLRFGFTLDINRFQPDEIRDSLSLDENDNEPLTDNEVLEWHTTQIQRITDSAPQLQEVCLFRNCGISMGKNIAGICRGTKSKGGNTMCVLLDAVQPGVECTRFPWGIGDEDDERT